MGMGWGGGEAVIRWEWGGVGGEAVIRWEWGGVEVRL